MATSLFAQAPSEYWKCYFALSGCWAASNALQLPHLFACLSDRAPSTLSWWTPRFFHLTFSFLSPLFLRSFCAVSTDYLEHWTFTRIDEFPFYMYARSIRPSISTLFLLSSATPVTVNNRANNLRGRATDLPAKTNAKQTLRLHVATDRPN